MTVRVVASGGAPRTRRTVTYVPGGLHITTQYDLVSPTIVQELPEPGESRWQRWPSELLELAWRDVGAPA